MIKRLINIITFLLIVLPQSIWGQSTNTECKNEIENLFSSGEFQKILDKFDKCGDFKDEPYLQYIHGFSLMKRGKYEESISYFFMPLKLDTIDVKCYTCLGVAYFNIGNMDSALVYYNKAISADPQFIYSYYNRSSWYYHNDRFDEAIEDINIHLKNHSDDVEGLLFKADLLDTIGKYQEALKCYDEALKIDPENGNIFDSRANFYFFHSEWDKAMLNIDSALVLEPKNAEFLLDKGDIYFFMDDFHMKEAQEYYLQALKNAKNPDEYMYYQIAETYYEIDKPKKAIPYYEKAIEIEPDDPDCYSDLAFSYYEIGKTKEGLESIEKAIEIWPNDAFYYYIKAILYEDENDYINAIKQYSKAISFEPDDADYYFERGEAYYYLDFYTEAESDLLTSIELGLKDEDAYFYLGYIHSVNKECDKAIMYYTKAIEIDPNYGVAYSNRGKCYYSQDEFQKACSDLKKAKSLKVSGLNPIIKYCCGFN